MGLVSANLYKSPTFYCLTDRSKDATWREANSLPYKGVAHGMISPKTCDNQNIFLRGDVGIAPYGGIVHLTAKQQFYDKLINADNLKA